MASQTYLRSFRLACEPGLFSQVEMLLEAEDYRFEPEPFSPFCRRLLTEPRPLGSSLAAIFGYIYIQDRSSMLPPLALGAPTGASVLDMCASPGSKTGFMAQLVGAGGFVLANEPNAARLETLRANMQHACFINVATCSYPGEKLPAGKASWNYVLLDPPCSGWGTVEKNPRVQKLWQGNRLATLEKLQRSLLKNAAELLAPGGLLLYSTCTTNYDENEAQTAFAERELGLERMILEPFPGFVYEERSGGAGCLLVEGKTSAAQGFYLSLLRKPGVILAKEKITSGQSAGMSLENVPQSPLFDCSRLPPGKIGVFGDRARFLPMGSEDLPASLVWKGALLGRLGKDGRIKAAPGLRCCLPDEPRIQLDDIESIYHMLAGRSVAVGSAHSRAGLWWRDLPLCAARVKNGRLVAAFR